MKPDPIHPQHFTFKPEKMLDDKSYASPRKTEKSEFLVALEAKQAAERAKEMEKVVRGKFPVSQR